MMTIIDNDPWLRPFETVIQRRNKLISEKESALLAEMKDLSSFSTGHLYFGLHKTEKAWVIREWAPNANAIFLVGDFNKWSISNEYALNKSSDGNWELSLPEDKINHLDQYKLHIVWDDGEGDRIPAWATRTLQDDQTKVFNAQVWAPEKSYQWKNSIPDLSQIDPIIYEAHIGMGTEEYKVGSFNEFREKVLPYIASSGYNTIQLMAVQEHPYYGSFGYHVSSLFAVSSRFGTPDELKQLIDVAHGLGIVVIMDIVHSHAVKNELEGLGLYAGDPAQFFHQGERREHVAWDSLCYDYGKNEVIHLLLSNVHFWLKEYNFDGFRFDGVTSMLYYDHGLERDFSGYEMYFDGGQDEDAITYMGLCNKLIQEIKPSAISIAEDMSGYPGLATPIEFGGIGFNFRLAMGIPDYWIKTIKEKSDENWNMEELYHELTSKRVDEQTIGYAESHDQALVGDKTLIFRLIDKDMYWHMDKSSNNVQVERGTALHKMIRLATIATSGNGYLNFMGNEFGHPEWIDFPREGNEWSYQYARRQWSLVKNNELRYQFLGEFDKAMVSVVKENNILKADCQHIKSDSNDLILAFSRLDFIFVFNFHPTQSYTDYGFAVDRGKYRCILSTDEAAYGGYERIDKSIEHRSMIERSFGYKQRLNLYLPSRSGIVLKKVTVAGVR